MLRRWRRLRRLRLALWDVVAEQYWRRRRAGSAGLRWRVEHRWIRGSRKGIRRFGLEWAWRHRGGMVVVVVMVQLLLLLVRKDVVVLVLVVQVRQERGWHRGCRGRGGGGD